MNAIEGRDLTHRFGGFVAVSNVDIDVAGGEVVGLLGANGAGKTTLMRMLLGLLPPSEGQVRVLGSRPTRAIRRRIGYVPQGMGLYGDLTVAQNRDFHHAAFGVTIWEAEVEVAADTLVEDLPLGVQRRLAFELALAHQPELLMLDEPTSGVGPLGRSRLWGQIRATAEADVAVLVTTHYLAEAEQCDRLVMMAAGHVVAEGTLEEVVAGHTVVHVDTRQPGPVLAALSRAGLVAALSGDGVAAPLAEVPAVESALEQAGLPPAVLRAVSRRSATLEERFVALASA